LLPTFGQPASLLQQQQHASSAECAACGDMQAQQGQAHGGEERDGQSLTASQEGVMQGLAHASSLVSCDEDSCTDAQEAQDGATSATPQRAAVEASGGGGEAPGQHQALRKAMAGLTLEQDRQVSRPASNVHSAPHPH
jgi:hypothetical protein